MTCRQAIEFIIDYLDRTFPADELRLFEMHLAVCDSCVAYLRTYEISIRMEKLVVQEMVEVPEEMVRAILASRGV
jgi:predicted anti-sigma-YlaC factor YlaD